MAYSLMFAPEFFWDDGTVAPEKMQPRRRPTCVYQALISMAPGDWDLLAREVFGVNAEQLDPHTVLDKIIETDTCRNLDPPVEVFIDPEGYHTILVY